MIFRRIAAVMIALASLHLPVAAVGATCADAADAGKMARGEPVAAHAVQHDGEAMAAEQPASGDGESWEVAGSPQGAQHSCGTGGETRCCASMMGCSAVVALAERGRAAAAAESVDRTHAPPIDVPRSFRPTLEPPPPKA